VSYLPPLLPPFFGGKITFYGGKFHFLSCFVFSLPSVAVCCVVIEFRNYLILFCKSAPGNNYLRFCRGLSTIFFLCGSTENLSRLVSSATDSEVSLVSVLLYYRTGPHFSLFLYVYCYPFKLFNCHLFVHITIPFHLCRGHQTFFFLI
jgi:hypothetical protein